MTDKELIESLKREIELLREIVALQKDAIAQKQPFINAPVVQGPSVYPPPPRITYCSTAGSNIPFTWEMVSLGSGS